MSDRQDSD